MMRILHIIPVLGRVWGSKARQIEQRTSHGSVFGPTARLLRRRGASDRNCRAGAGEIRPPVYVRHEIVHNKYVVESLKNKGAIFVEDLSEVPPKAVTVFSAHGVARTVEEEAAARGLPVLNATCPLVTIRASATCRRGAP
jgi:hypothetical protein